MFSGLLADSTSIATRILTAIPLMTVARTMGTASHATLVCHLRKSFITKAPCSITNANQGVSAIPCNSNSKGNGCGLNRLRK
jgi:hypothetical protein